MMHVLSEGPLHPVLGFPIIIWGFDCCRRRKTYLQPVGAEAENLPWSHDEAVKTDQAETSKDVEVTSQTQGPDAEVPDPTVQCPGNFPRLREGEESGQVTIDVPRKGLEELLADDPVLARQLREATQRFAATHAALASCKAPLPLQLPQTPVTPLPPLHLPPALGQAPPRAAPLASPKMAKALVNCESSNMAATVTKETEEPTAPDAAWTDSELRSYVASKTTSRAVEHLFQELLARPIPEPWVIVRSSAGKAFFANRSNRKTSWSHPLDKTLMALERIFPDVLEIDTSERVKQLNALREGWEQEEQEELNMWAEVPAREGREAYYYHIETEETSWMNPEQFVKPLYKPRYEVLDKLAKSEEYIAKLRKVFDRERNVGGLAARAEEAIQLFAASAEEDDSTSQVGLVPGTPESLPGTVTEPPTEEAEATEPCENSEAEPQVKVPDAADGILSCFRQIDNQKEGKIRKEQLSELFSALNVSEAMAQKATAELEEEDGSIDYKKFVEWLMV